MPGVCAGNAICGMSPELASMLSFSVLAAFKTARCRSGSSLLGKRGLLIEVQRPASNQFTHSVVARDQDTVT